MARYQITTMGDITDGGVTPAFPPVPQIPGNLFPGLEQFLPHQQQQQPQIPGEIPGAAPAPSSSSSSLSSSSVNPMTLVVGAVIGFCVAWIVKG